MTSSFLQRLFSKRSRRRLRVVAAWGLFAFGAAGGWTAAAEMEKETPPLLEPDELVEAAEADINALRGELEDVFRSLALSIENRDLASLQALASPALRAVWTREAAEAPQKTDDGDGDLFDRLADELVDWGIQLDPEHVAFLRLIGPDGSNGRAEADNGIGIGDGIGDQGLAAKGNAAGATPQDGDGGGAGGNSGIAVLVYLDLGRDDDLGDWPVPSLGGAEIVRAGARDAKGEAVPDEVPAPWRVFHWLRFVESPVAPGWVFDGGAWIDRPADFLSGPRARADEAELRATLRLPPLPPPAESDEDNG